MGQEITTPQAVRESNSRVPGIHVHQENTQFSINQLMECQFQMREMAQKLVNTPLFSFQDLKVNTKDIIVILKDTLNTTSGPLPILDPHARGVPSNTLERHLIGSRVVDGIHNLVISCNMHKLVGSPTFNSSFTRELRTPPHLWVCYSAKALWITIFSIKTLIHFRRWCLVKELPSPSKMPLLTTLNQQSRWENIHPEWYFLIHMPNQWFLEFNSPKRSTCLIPIIEIYVANLHR